ncbi:MAG: ABC transporter ATP-binding protein [Gemmatimonadota bacterium]|jgi:ABC-2 type transport system ATP-binding protein
MAESAIRTERLTRDFGAVRAVDEVTLEVPRGAIFGFLGPNGAGKTTMIRLLLGLLDPTDGTASVLGHDTRTASDRIRERTGALLEHTGLYERLSAYDNLEYFGRIWHIPAADRKTRIQELLTRFGLWERRTEHVVKWSRGMKQKLAVARTLLHRPALIFLDEPTAGLDPVAAAALRDDLDGLAEREGVTVFLTTHNLTEAEKLCDQVGVIRTGRLIAVGPPRALRERSGGRQVEFVGRGFSDTLVESVGRQAGVQGAELKKDRLVVRLSDIAEVAPLTSLLVRGGAEVEEVRKDSASLEDVFLMLMEEK